MTPNAPFIGHLTPVLYGIKVAKIEISFVRSTKKFIIFERKYTIFKQIFVHQKINVMIVTGLILLFTMLFGSPSIPTFIVEDLPKEVKANIDDKERQKEILAVLNDYEDESKKSQKELDKVTKRLKELNSDRLSPKDSIVAELNIALDIWKELQTNGIDKRIQVKDMITPEEWEKIIANSVAEFDKKELKAHEKLYKNFNKELYKVQEVMADKVADMERRKKIEAAFDSYSKDVKDYIDANIDRTLKNHAAFRNLDATKQELLEALSSVESSREEFFDGIVKLHFELVEYTTDDEWGKISKAINDMY